MQYHFFFRERGAREIKWLTNTIVYGTHTLTNTYQIYGILFSIFFLSFNLFFFVFQLCNLHVIEFKNKRLEKLNVVLLCFGQKKQNEINKIRKFCRIAHSKRSLTQSASGITFSCSPNGRKTENAFSSIFFFGIWVLSRNRSPSPSPSQWTLKCLLHITFSLLYSNQIQLIRPKHV